MAVPTAAYLIIVLAVLVGGWAIASLYYFIQRHRRGRDPSWLAPNADSFQRPSATVGRGLGSSGWFTGSTGRSGVFGSARADAFQLRQEWRVVVDVAAIPKLVEVEVQETDKDAWTPLNVHIQASKGDQPPNLTASFLISLPSLPTDPKADSPEDDPAPPPPLTDLEFGTTSLPLSPTSFAELVPLAVPEEKLGPMEQVINGVRMRREWVRSTERAPVRMGWI